MKIILLVISLGLLIFNFTNADEKSCPSDRAADLGHDPFGAFHEIMAPTWHVAWPDSNFADLFEAGPKFKKLFKGIKNITPSTRSERRNNLFIERRKEFEKIVKEYAKAAKDNNKEKVYELMPILHEIFESTASALIPIQYPQFEGAGITCNIILKEHLPNNNMDGIIGSTETLLMKLKHLTPETIPNELKEYEPEITQSFKNMLMLTILMQKCCNEKDMESYKNHMGNLEKIMGDFIIKYLWES